MKNSAPQAMATSMVWPKSGSATSSAATMASRMSGEDVAGNVAAGASSRRTARRTTTTKAGFMNSDGCSERPARLSQRRAPLTSTPTNSVASISTMRDGEHDQRRAPRLRGDRSEVAIITASAGKKKATWRLTKWKLS